MSALEADVPTAFWGENNYAAQGDTAARGWAGLTRAQWRSAKAQGHQLLGGQRPGDSNFMGNGFHCTCGEWSVPQEQVSTPDSRAVSSPSTGYRLWADHLRETPARPIPERVPA